MKKILAVLMTALTIAALAVPAFAGLSPENTEGDYAVDIGTVTGNGDVSKTENSDGTYTLVATPHDGETFIKWVLDGDFELISGSLTSSTITVKLKGDLKANAVFTGAAANANGSTSVDNSSKSPATGTYTVLYVLAAVAALGVAVVATKRVVEAD